MVAGWLPMGFRVIPGRSTSVKSGELGRCTVSEMGVLTTPTPLPAMRLVSLVMCVAMSFKLLMRSSLCPGAVMLAVGVEVAEALRLWLASGEVELTRRRTRGTCVFIPPYSYATFNGFYPSILPLDIVTCSHSSRQRR